MSLMNIDAKYLKKANQFQQYTEMFTYYDKVESLQECKDGLIFTNQLTYKQNED